MFVSPKSAGRAGVGLFCLFLLAAAELVPGLHADERLARPAGLEPEIGFWRKIFTEVDSRHALVHDNRHLAVVYEKVAIPRNASAAQRRRVAEQARRKYSRILTTLADGKRDGFTTEERRVLELWPDDVSREELRQATRRIRFQQGLADRFRDGLVRSGRWQEHIAAALRDHDVPAQLVALPHVESSFNPEARSHVGAAGLWQFTHSTGRRFMQVDHVVDGRRDPFISSDAAARLLAYNYSILNSWPLAITAYNHGVAGMRRAVRDTGTEDIETIIRQYRGRAFGFASRNFYVAFLAASEVHENAERYFGSLQMDRPRVDLVIELPDYVPAAALADVFGIDEARLRRYNPALLDPVWHGSKYVPRGFPLRLPADRLSDTGPRLLAAIPATQRHDEQTPDLYHRVERGDSLSVIAARYRTSVSELVALNDLRSRHRIRAGQVLRLPFAGDVPSSPIEAGTATYTVRAGDTLGSIAARAGVGEAELIAWNGITDRNRIYPGQTLALRSEAEPAAAVAAATAVADSAADPDMAAAAAEPAATPPVDEALVAEEPVVVADQGDASNESELLTDPADYLVAADLSIEVQAAETLGHYADWLEIRTQRLRDINRYAFHQPVVIGRRLQLDFSRVSEEEFVARRMAYHRALQEAFFSRYRVAETTVHRLRRGESLWVLARQRYEVPVWLLRQYNPDLDLDRVRPGLAVVFPRVEAVDRAARNQSALADAS